MTDEKPTTKLKHAILSGLSTEFDNLPLGVQRRLHSFGTRANHYIQRANTVRKERTPSGREYLKRRFLGNVRSVARFIDGELVPPRKSVPQPTSRTKPKKVVGKK